ncbi:hypothetical protein ACFVOR_37535 [Streptomyces sp. NPDC057837]|uniref:hypothetical protein n=1 Tax=Streptomyces sp. NPDC057837 TaxID=3346260 RepID=UPI0036A560CE
MSAARILGASIPAVLLLIALFGTWWVVRQERRKPTSYTRQEPSPAQWRAMSTVEQEAYDNAVLDAAEAAEVAVRRAVDAQVQQAIEDAARRSSLFKF